MHKGKQQQQDSHSRVVVRDKEATRRRILDAAEEVFAEKGYHDTAIDDIVHAAAMSKGGFYFHFPSKQAIFLALLQALTPRLISAVEQAISEESTSVARLDAALRTVLDTFSRHRRLTKILLIEAVGLGHGFEKQLIEVRAEFAGVIQKYLDQAIDAGEIAPVDTKITALAWLGAVNEIVTRWLIIGDPEHLEDVIPALRGILLRSVGIHM
ncbi:MAG: TetR/AcrR family transcriptional regulator [Chloroflexota bacterium]|nr:TetR/AcrR family transcriptional regulator [Chloroflexota bacterium]